jgi:hypothetical protein
VPSPLVARMSLAPVRQMLPVRLATVEFETLKPRTPIGEKPDLNSQLFYLRVSF